MAPAASMTADNMRLSAALVERWAKTPKFKPHLLPFATDQDYGNSALLQRAVWMFENGITRCATVFIGDHDFDSHFWNTRRQSVLVDYAGRLLVSLLAELDSKKVDGRPLSEQTVVFVGSEIGRFPRLNAARGKDHFPQAPYMFFGPWFETGGTFGETDRDMISKPVSLATGKPQAGGHMLVLDDIGRTLLELDGANPEVFGYTGERLSFLLA